MDEPRSVLRPVLDPAIEFSDSDLFWQEHWKKFVWALAGVIALILAVGAWKFWTATKLSSAEALYSSAGGAEAWREVVAKYPGTVPAGNAQIRLAESLREGGDLPAAAAELEKFLASQPEHPLAGAAWLTLGELLQFAEALDLPEREESAVFLPSPEQIRLAAAAIRAGWTRAELEARRMPWSGMLD